MGSVVSAEVLAVWAVASARTTVRARLGGRKLRTGGIWDGFGIGEINKRHKEVIVVSRVANHATCKDKVEDDD